MTNIAPHIWTYTLLGLGVVLFFDLAYALWTRNKPTSLREAVFWTLTYMGAAIIFGIFMKNWVTPQNQKEFFAGWITEYSLSFDNLFVFLLIMARMKIKSQSENLILFIGIVSSLVLRGVFIFSGSALVNRFTWTFFIFGGFLIYTAITLLKETEHAEWKEGRFITYLRKKGVGQNVLALIAIAITNIVFAFDSIPAIFGLTKSTYVIVTANIFAVMGLRQLYFLIGGLMNKLKYLSEGLAILLAFIGIKLILEAAISQGWEKILGVHVPEISLSFSLIFILLTLILTTVISLISTAKENKVA